MTKHWVSENKQASVGEWPDNTPDEQIVAELLEQAGSSEQRETIRAGTIEREDMSAEQVERTRALYRALLDDYRRVRAALANIVYSTARGEFVTLMVDDGKLVHANHDHAQEVLDDCQARPTLRGE